MATKRAPLATPKTTRVLKQAAAAVESPTDGPEKEKPITTGISLSRPVFDLLLDVANARKKKRGGRASVSGVISDLVERNRAALEAELK